jgi:hypothetical protein
MNQKYNLVIYIHTMLCLSVSEDEITTYNNHFKSGVQIREISRRAVKNIVVNRLGLYTM